MEYQRQWQVPSSDGQRTYTVSLTLDGQWQCSCVGWTRHMPRRDCKHIKGVRGTADSFPNLRSQLEGRMKEYAAFPATPASPSMTAKAAVKAGFNPDEASAVSRAKREETQAKKAKNLGKYRYGFQLAHTYEPADLDRGEWVAEIKYDGILAMLIDGRLVNRSGNDVTHRFPEITRTGDAVVVGEIVVLDAGGNSHFNLIQERNTDDPIKIAGGARANPATFVVFDMLEDGDHDITAAPLKTRRGCLEAWAECYDGARGIKLIEQLPVRNDRDVQALVEAARRLDGEGVMLKRLDAPYVARRGRNWVKAKTWQEREFDIVRYEDTGVGDGFVVWVVNRGREQRVNCGSHEMRRRVRAGHKRVEIKFLSEGEDGAMRFPTVRRLV